MAAEPIANEWIDGVTVVTYGRMVHESLTAAAKLAEEGIDCEVIDLRTVQPLDTETVTTSARRTNRIVVVHEAVRFGGLGAEIAAQVQEHSFDYLDAPVGRIVGAVHTDSVQPRAGERVRPERRTHRRWDS